MNDYSEYIKKIFSKISSLIIADSVSLILMVLFSILFGRIFGEDLFGKFSLSFILITIFRTIIDLGFDYSLPRSISIDPKNAYIEIINTQITKLYIFITLSPIAIIISLFTTLSFSFFILYLSLLPNTVSSTLRAALRGFSDMKTIAKIDTLVNIMLYIVAAIFVLFKFELWSIFTLFILFESLKSFWYFNKIKNKIQNLHFANFFILLKRIYGNKDKNENFKNYSFNYQIFSIINSQIKLLSINLLSVLHFRFSSIMLGILSNTFAVGEFSAALRFLTALRVIPGAILNTLLPDFSKPTKEKKGSKLYLFVFLFALGLIISILLYIFSKPLMMLTFGFENSIRVLNILAWGFVLAVLSFFCEAYLLSKNKEKYVNISLIIALIVTLIASVLTIPQVGAIGAAISALTAEGTLFLSYVFFITREKMLNLRNQ